MGPAASARSKTETVSASIVFLIERPVNRGTATPQSASHPTWPRGVNYLVTAMGQLVHLFARGLARGRKDNEVSSTPARDEQR